MYSFLGSFAEGLRPEPLLTVTEWAEKYRKLDTKSAAEAGDYRISRTPYLKEISDHLSPQSPAQNIVVMKGVQLGFTEIGFNWIGCTVDCFPCPMLAIMPTLDTMKRNVKMRLDPMIESTPQLKNKIGVKRSKDGGNTMFQKDYPGGALILTGANSAAGLRSMPIKNLLLDEIDGYPGDVDGEGDPISLAEKRQNTFGSRKKKYKISTPTIKGQSKIEAEFERTDQRYYFVPCPHCKEFQTLEFEQLRWEPGGYSTDSVHYECRHCKGKIYERHKTQMLLNGYWEPTKPENISVYTVGYHINTLYSPDGWMAWHELCKEWDEAQGNEERLKTAVNTLLARTYEVDSEQPEWERLYERAQAEDTEPNKPRISVAFITCGVDVQSDRLECELVGWSENFIHQQIDYRVLDGDTDKNEVWDKLGELLTEQWQRENGSHINIRLMGVDAGYRPAKVDEFAKKWGTRVVPLKGSDSLQIPVSAPKVSRKTKQGQSIGKLKQWSVGVSYLKSQIYGWLRQSINPETGEVPKGYCWFTKRDTHYFRGITAEAYQPSRNTKNQLVYYWVKKYERNEPLDCRVYSLACAYMLGFDRWSEERWKREHDITVEPAKKTTTRKRREKNKKTKGGGFWDRS